VQLQELEAQRAILGAPATSVGVAKSVFLFFQIFRRGIIRIAEEWVIGASIRR
jgi:hypothetical protein